ncbi:MULTISPECIES: RsmF rRNA methyltransferase first C-terminal domain-containing protein [Streptococcus]|jgi:ftsJ-like methyltransferase|uniref:RsmF rRNA methyltransferase first C-terminal domain-containing protein n=2 Tax=Streptococcus gordonii TaxID=1302 RepID=A0AB35FTS0_STRGN|nr:MULTISPECIES: RsmF rRNA methyltransferase first C-terminal domain-containing protein [Streptococcus]MBW7662665.1 RsmF rRNA methyltransferase first C-terminal domain-containing protein [Streptococcus gordonii]MBZ2127639.1 RsmF rRNA methyltransferase first C-terminal domain-containing protein [Streptococcus gordonii]MBZ2129967.1 RsmF rRNA methyltransferase first C-terminal domain-containing protein [Streptococcus gordonii]MDU3101887.1 RsmF rRNA methyltransferase first C-terminal domain-contain
MRFPTGFEEKYQRLLGKEAASFFSTFDQEPISAFRTNPLKEGRVTFSNPIPGTKWGYYGKVSGKSPEHVTGLIYSQEPAAQMVAQVAHPHEGMRVLDLAAAPGGKSTHLLSYLNNTGLLVSNEINNKRSKILVENIERFGARNVLVTNESAERLAKVFSSFFDLIVLDAPCSGEGMFRKQPDAMDYWSLDYPAQCATLQREILEDAVKMLANGGELVYSTCTWAPEENEEIVAWLLDEFPLELVDIPKLNGMTPGIDYPETARMYPHHFKGEGQFVAKFRFVGEHKLPKLKPARSNLTADQRSLWQIFQKEHLKVELKGDLQTFGDQLYLLPLGLPDLSKVKIARNGLHLGTFKKKRFEPSFALGLALQPSEVRNKLELSQQDFEVYVGGETLQIKESLPNGWYQLIIHGNGLGFAKLANQTLKNYFPKGLRFR